MVVTWECRSLLTCNFRKLEHENSESVFTWPVLFLALLRLAAAAKRAEELLPFESLLARMSGNSSRNIMIFSKLLI